MSGTALMRVEDALTQIIQRAKPLSTEMVALAQAYGRTLGEDLVSKRTQPPAPVSAMDGYAIRVEDLAAADSRLHCVGVSVAGKRFDGTLKPMEAVRIFTGAVVPPGANGVIMQEDVKVEGDYITASKTLAKGRNIRAAGLDFHEGEVLLRAGHRLGAAELALAAAMNHAQLPVTRRPIVAILATGDELVAPGQTPGPDQIVASNTFAISAHILRAGGEPLDLGIAGDNFAALEMGITRARAQKADVLITLGGASVGDHDLVKSALSRQGMELHFWRIAMRPGKPLIHGSLGDMQILGLPGNPVSSIVCGHLFLMPLIRRLSGDLNAGHDITEPATLASDLPANDERQDYMRAKLIRASDGSSNVETFAMQDSSMLKVFAEAECLLVRAPFEPAMKAGSPCRIIRLERPL